MPVPSLLPIGGAAIGLLASRTLTSLVDGLSFKSVLTGNQATGSDKNGTTATEARVSLNLAEVTPQFVSGLRDRLQAAGVDLSQPFTLKDDGHGTVIVDGEHPDRATIERVLAEDSKLASEFQEIASAASERRQSYPLGMDNVFGEFRLKFSDGIAAIRFE